MRNPVTPLFLSAILIILAFGFAPAAYANEKEKCFYGDPCKSNFDVRIKKCAKEKFDYFKLICLFPVSGIYPAYEHLYGLPYLEENNINPSKALLYLRLQALKSTKTDNEKSIINIKKAGIDAPKLSELFEKAIIWAEEEKQKPAEELYQLAHSVIRDTGIKDIHLKNRLRITYLRLAIAKGHKQAAKEEAIIVEETKEKVDMMLYGKRLEP